MDISTCINCLENNDLDPGHCPKPIHQAATHAIKVMHWQLVALHVLIDLTTYLINRLVTVLCSQEAQMKVNHALLKQLLENQTHPQVNMTSGVKLQMWTRS